MKVIGAGVGRTGTYSLKLALERLGLGRCHHMEEVLHHMPVQVPLWVDALAGRPDWDAIYDGYGCAVDWPTARFFRELSAAHPEARFVLTHRSPESWVRSFSGTIYELVAKADAVPPEMREWLRMATDAIAATGFPLGLDAAELERAFVAHNEAVREAIAAERLLVFEVKEGWGPLCAFLGLEVPEEPFPRTNHREEFWDRVSGKG